MLKIVANNYEVKVWQDIPFKKWGWEEVEKDKKFNIHFKFNTYYGSQLVTHKKKGIT